MAVPGLFRLQLRMAVPGHFVLVSLVCVWITTENGGPWSVQITTENGGPWSLCVGVPGLCLDYN